MRISRKYKHAITRGERKRKEYPFFGGGRMRKRFVYPWHIWKKSPKPSKGHAQKQPKSEKSGLQPLPRHLWPVEETHEKPVKTPRVKKASKPTGRHGNKKDLSGRFSTKGDITEISCPSGQIGIIDTEDLPLVKDYPWCATRGYLCARVNQGTITRTSIHRIIMNAPKGSIIDHINGNGLDNRKSNLRFATSFQNAWNSKAQAGHQYKGVRFVKRAQAYSCSIRANNKHFNLKLYDTAEEAAAAYNKAAKILHGEFARLNNTPIQDVEIKRRANKYSKFKGLHWRAKEKVWVTQVSLNGHSKYIGQFKDEIEAAKAYDKAAKDIFDTGAVLNFPITEPVVEGPLFFLRKFNSKKPKKSNTSHETHNSITER